MPAEQADPRGESRQTFFAKQQLIASAKAAFQQFAAVVKNATLYPAAHPFFLASADQLLHRLEGLMAGGKDAEFYLVAGELFFETHSVPVDQAMSALMEQCKSLDAGGIIFRRGVTRDELTTLTRLVNSDPASLDEGGGFASVLKREGVTHVEVHRVLPIQKKAASGKAGQHRPGEVFADAVNMVKEIVHTVHLGKTVNMRKVDATVHTMVDHMLDNRDALLGLTSIKMYDEYTFAHSVNTSILSIALGGFLSFDKSQIGALGIAGLLHDIGKISVPLEIINKPEKLTDEEWEIIKRHPIEGALILSDIPGVSRLAMVAAFEHHQHNDTRGYPRIDDTVQQHPFSQIVALADAYDALTATRVYYNVPIPADKAVRILLQKRGTAFDPVLVKAFVNMIGLFPIGTLLKLDTGETGLVVHQTRDLLRPRVLLLTSFDGSEKESGAEVSLLETSRGRYLRTAVASVDPHAANINVKQYLD